MAGGNVASAIARADERIEWYWQGHQVALDVARGLFFLHSHGVLHGDIKSQNVLLTETWTAKVRPFDKNEYTAVDVSVISLPERCFSRPNWRLVATALHCGSQRLQLGDVGLARLNSDEAGAALAWTLACELPPLPGHF